MKAALILTGAELLNGVRRDALVQPFTSILKSRGAAVHEIRIIGDDPAALLSTIEAVGADLKIVTGGLGATPDDTTHLVIDKLRQRSVAEGEVPNLVGMASGVDLQLESGRVVFLPGVPKEALPMLQQVADSLSQAVEAKVEIMAIGLGETEIARRLGPLAAEMSFLPKDMEVLLVAAPAHEAAIREILGIHALRELGVVPSLGRIFRERSLTFAAAESCTGGLIGHLVTAEAGCSDYFLGSLVTYHNALKENLLGVSPATLAEHGAVSEEVARQMLLGLLERSGADCGVATTGIAGPDGGTDDKPLGTLWVAVGSRENQVVRRFNFARDRASNKMFFAKRALFALLEFLYDQDIHRTEPS